MYFADVKNDLAFHKIFGNEQKTGILIAFLNAVLRLENNSRIVEVKILNPYQAPIVSGMKNSIIDIRAKDDKDNYYIIEMQLANKKGFNKRILYYACKEYASQLHEKQKYYGLHPIIVISILNFEYLLNSHYLSKHAIVDLATQERKIRDMEFNFIELPKFNKTEAEADNDLDKWIYFIKNAASLQLIPTSVDNDALREAYYEADKHLWTKIELADYEDYLIRDTDEEARELFMMERIEELNQKSEELNQKSEEIEKKSEEIEKKSEEIEKKSEEIEKKSEEIEKKSEEIEKKSEEIEKKSEEIEKKSEEIEKKSEEIEKKSEEIEKKSEEIEKKSEEIEKKSEEIEKALEKKQQQVINMVKVLKNEGFSTEKISSLTGLSATDIEAI